MPSSATLLMLALAALAAVACVAASTGSDLPPPGKAILPLHHLSILGFDPACLARFSALDLFSDKDCLAKSFSKALGCVIILGAAVVKLPQVLKIVSAGSVSGISPSAAYLELIGYILQATWHIVHNGSPFSAYGETVIVAAQSAFIILLIWRYSFPGMAEVGGMGVALALVTYGSLNLPSNTVQNASTALFAAARLWQIISNQKQGHTGELAFLTLFMQFAGAAARIFTTIKEVGQPVAVASTVIAAGLNGILLLQALLMGGAKDHAKKAAPTTTSAAPAAAAGRKGAAAKKVKPA